jgi:hypothetical protein
MAIALRPLELKQVFDYSIRIYRRNFAPMVLLAALLQAPLALAGTVITYHLVTVMNALQTAMEADPSGDSFPSPEEFFGDKLELWILLGALLVVAGLVQLLALPYVNVAIARLATSGLLGAQCTLPEALAHARARYWPTQAALALYVLPVLLIALLTLLPVLGLQASGDSTAVIVAAASSMGFIWLAALLTFLFYFRVFPAICGALQAVEDPPPQLRGIGAQALWYLKRSYALTSRHYWRVVGFLFLLYMAVGFIQRGVGQSVNLLVWLIWLPTHLPSGNTEEQTLAIIESTNDPTVLAWSLALSALFGLLLPALALCYQAVLYLDLRCRKEAFDLELLLARQPRPLAPADSAHALSSGL